MDVVVSGAEKRALEDVQLMLVRQLAMNEAILERFPPDVRAEIRKRAEQIYATMLATADAAEKEMEPR